MDATEGRLWSIEEVSDYLGIPRSSVYKMTARGVIPHVKLGGRVRFRQRDLDHWLDLLVVSNLETLARAKKLSRGR